MSSRGSSANGAEANQRRRSTLDELNLSTIRWSHIRACIVSGVGFFTDAYDLFSINIVSYMIGLAYYGGNISPEDDLLIKISASVGKLRKLAQCLDKFSSAGTNSYRPMTTYTLRSGSTHVHALPLYHRLADHLGRKKMYGVELLIIIIACFGSALSSSSPFAINLVGSLLIWRLVMGVGIGGDYPLSAVITSEFASQDRRGAMMGIALFAYMLSHRQAAVFSMQGTIRHSLLLSHTGISNVTSSCRTCSSFTPLQSHFPSSLINTPGLGQLTAALFSLTLIAISRSALATNILYVDYTWRIITGAGAIPAIFAFYYRLTIPETPRYTMDVENKINKGRQDAKAWLEEGAARGNYCDQDLLENVRVRHPASWSDFKNYFSRWENAKLLVAMSFCWFALDVGESYCLNYWEFRYASVYGLGLNTTKILDAISISGDSVSSYDNLKALAVGNALINLLGSLPGYLVTILLIEKLGRRKIQLMGFGALTVIYLAMGFAFTRIYTTSKALFVVLYALGQFFQNFGPNATTSTCHGIAAASGKLGAILAQFIFYVLTSNENQDMYSQSLGGFVTVAGFFMFAGFCVTFLLPETKNRSLEELSNEDQTGFLELVGNTQEL
ncbi:phosphate transporter, partial [Endogone sp. FLAS-F59071]